MLEHACLVKCLRILTYSPVSEAQLRQMRTTGNGMHQVWGAEVHEIKMYNLRAFLSRELISIIGGIGGWN